MVNHLVLFRLKEKTSQISRQLMDAFVGLPEKIEEIQHLEVGEDFKTTPKSFDVALSVEFGDRESLSTFSVHPEYVPVLDLIHEICSEYAVVDMEIESN
jgi:hypothetical protein